MKKQGLQFFKKYKVIDMARASCMIFLALLLILLCTTRENWFIPLLFSVGLFSIYFINGFLDKVKIASTTLSFLEFSALVCYGLFFPNNYLSTVFSLVLVDFYLKNDLKMNIFFGSTCFVGYATTTLLTLYKTNVNIDFSYVLEIIANDFVVFALVFCIVNMLSTIIKRNEEISKNLDKIALRERELKKAYESLKEKSQLEERNRIAKQIHDTTGHSITNIIMLTEAAKIEIETDKDGAKNKIISANLQAVRALEEMRKSIHVLSGQTEKFNLISAINKTIAETTDNTGIVIRAKYPENLDINDDLAYFIYSSLKEGLNNGIRHGKATAFFFELKNFDTEILFLLQDNGVGVEPLTLGYGLKSMKEHAEKYGGEIEFNSEIDDGFEIKILFKKS